MRRERRPTARGDASSLSWRRKARQSGHESGERPAQPFMLIGIEMNSVDRARWSDAAGIEERAAEFGGNVAVGVSQPRPLVSTAAKLRSNRPSPDQDRPRRHPPA